VEFQAKSERLDDLTLVVSVAGELDVYTVPHLERALLAADGARSVVVELSECTFVDSSTLAVLLEASRRLSLSDARLLIVATSADVLRPFELTGLDSEFAFHASVAAALNGGMR
jgi:anti-sigma B factor antagonist